MSEFVISTSKNKEDSIGDAYQSIIVALYEALGTYKDKAHSIIDADTGEVVVRVDVLSPFLSDEDVEDAYINYRQNQHVTCVECGTTRRRWVMYGCDDHILCEACFAKVQMAYARSRGIR